MMENDNRQLWDDARRGLVVSPHSSSYLDPLMVRLGENVRIVAKTSEWPGWIWCVNSGNKGGWVPEKYIMRKDDRNGVILTDFSTAELSVTEQEEILVAREESGWFWCMNQQGDSGWVPAQCIQIVG
ncbi:MAG: SH3 domain-containing protein [candidate division Zixibacteria bacterium]|nr:SH3 domain-containing protein [candidate division Zixibacteria bacterium]